MKYTDENKAIMLDKRRKDKSKRLLPSAAETLERERKKPRIEDKKKRVLEEREPEYTLPLCDYLKVHLIEDWERITKNQQIVPLPRVPNVADILAQYQGHKRESIDYQVHEEISNGILRYFDASLGTLLLYRFERQQYLEVFKIYTGTPMSRIYGGEHLLRLLVQMPKLLETSQIPKDVFLAIREQLMEFITWFGSRRSVFLLSDYENPSTEYLNLAKAQ